MTNLILNFPDGFTPNASQVTILKRMESAFAEVSVWDSVEESVWNSVGNSVRHYVGDSVKNKLREYDFQ